MYFLKKNIMSKSNILSEILVKHCFMKKCKKKKKLGRQIRYLRKCLKKKK